MKNRHAGQTSEKRAIERAREALSRSATRDRHRREYALSNSQYFQKSCQELI